VYYTRTGLIILATFFEHVFKKAQNIALTVDEEIYVYGGDRYNHG